MEVTADNANISHFSPLSRQPPGLCFPLSQWGGVSKLVTEQSIVPDLPTKACNTKDNMTQLQEAQEEAVQAFACSMKHIKIHGIQCGDDSRPLHRSLEGVQELAYDKIDQKKAQKLIEKEKDVNEEMQVRLI
eukprot:9438437-Ditylum_brightwellii.AAC.1